MKNKPVDVGSFVSVAIPTNQSFLQQYYPWTHGKVARHFKRDKERILDTAQNVRLRLLSKDFIGRWFFKHLTDELVDRVQAERILGGVPITFVGAIQPVCGRRSSPDSIWRIKDLLEFAHFDYERFYYSIQGHTIDSSKFLRLLGYKGHEFSVLESLYRQGRIKPAELTEHACTEVVIEGKRQGSGCSQPGCVRKHYSLGYCSTHYRLSRSHKCSECEHGRELLAQRGISLTNRWSDSKVADAVAKLRWNDKQLKPFLREWRRQNMVSTTPLYIKRTDPKHGIDAGLLKYAEMVIDHEVVNDFKRISRADDLSTMVLNEGMSPEFGDSETVAWETDEKEDNKLERIIRDSSAHLRYNEVEGWHDLKRLIEAANLTDEELDVLVSFDLGDMTIRQYSDKSGKPVPRVHRIRTAALKKLRGGELPDSVTNAMAKNAAARNGCTVEEMLGSGLFGPCVVARTEFFSALYDTGMTVPRIASRFNTTQERVVAAINRAFLREGRTP